MCFGIARKAGLAIILPTLFLVACGGGEERQAKYLERANNYIEQENIEKAKVEIKNVLQINPNNAEAWYLLGVIAEDEQSFRAAYGNFTAAVGIDPQHVKSLNKLASYSILSNDLQNALEKIEQVLAVDQTNADAITLQALVFLQQDKKEAAIEKALLALSIEPGHVQATGLLTAIYAKENPELALELIDKALSEQSKDEALTMLKIQVLASQDKRDEVISLHQELIAEYPDNLLYPLQLVRLYISDDRKEESVRKDMAEQLLIDRLNEMPEVEQLKLSLAEFLV